MYATGRPINLGFIIFLGLLVIVSSIFSFVFVLIVMLTCVAKQNKINILKNNYHFVLDLSLAIPQKTLNGFFGLHPHEATSKLSA